MGEFDDAFNAEVFQQVHMKILAERDVGYHRRVRRRRTFSPGTEVQSQVRPGDREKVLEWLFEVRC